MLLTIKNHIILNKNFVFDSVEHREKLTFTIFFYFTFSRTLGQQKNLVQRYFIDRYTATPSYAHLLNLWSENREIRTMIKVPKAESNDRFD